MRILTVEQTKLLHSWIAAGCQYPELHQRMCQSFGVALSPAGVTWHRQHYKTAIDALRHDQQRQAERREQSRLAKQRQRAGIRPIAHCATCHCFDFDTAS